MFAEGQTVPDQTPSDMPAQKPAGAMPQSIVPHGPVGRLIGWVRELLNWQANNWALLHLPPEARVLEIGFGTGRLATMCLKRGGVIYYAGVDPSHIMVQSVRRRLAALKLDTRFELKESDDRGLDWPDASFDAILAVHSFHFWCDPEATLHKVGRLLAPGGRLILVQRMHGRKPPAWLPNSFCREKDQRAGARRALIRAGFSITQDRRINPRSYGIVAEYHRYDLN
ncbi:MAG: class I SAM-dependent methyltransferase [Alphaproteobacteria bacterium]|nr:MAG: class I SAM-dependent methyltransferase [Alphaproteobacteria bacterium]